MGTGLRIAGGVFVFAAILAAAFIFQTWIIMLVAGAASSAFGWPDPAWSFGQTAVASLILGVVGVVVRGIFSR